MADPFPTGQPEIKRAESTVFGKLLKLGLLPYRAAGGIRINTGKGSRLALQTVLPARDIPDGEVIFAVPYFQPTPELFVLCVESAEDESPAIWVFPSISFLVYAEPDEGQGLISLSLDSARTDSFAESLREYVSFFRNRWEPIVQFDDLRQYMPPVDEPGFQRSWEDFEDILMLMEFSENRRSDSETSIPFEPPDPDPEYGNPLVELTAAAKEQLERIPADDREAVEEAIRSLADNSRPSGSIGLTGGPGRYWIRRTP